ncbi:MAG TPA: hypothetical protein PK280_19510 [Planctomycetota bacterium]|nr:hypothetical protein [Planctomycetota bacterium]
MPDSDASRPAPPASPAAGTGPSAPEADADEPRGFPWLRVLAGAMLLAVAAAALAWFLRPDDLVLEARFEPASLRSGERARLFLRVSPGTGLGDVPLDKVRAEIERCPADLVFDRPGEFLLPGEGRMVLEFTVDRRAAPGVRRLVVTAAAQVPAGDGRALAHTVGVRRELEVTVGAPAASEEPSPASGGGPAAGGRAP